MNNNNKKEIKKIILIIAAILIIMCVIWGSVYIVFLKAFEAWDWSEIGNFSIEIPDTDNSLVFHQQTFLAQARVEIYYLNDNGKEIYLYNKGVDIDSIRSVSENFSIENNGDGTFTVTYRHDTREEENTFNFPE